MPQAFVLRITPSEIDRVKEALDTNQLIIGWSEVDLTAPNLTWNDFINKLKKAYGPEVSNRQAGSWTGSLTRFIQSMKEGDLVLVPHGSQFYVAKVKGPCTYDHGRITDDTAHQRMCNWLNDKMPIDRIAASSALQWRLKARQTCVDATDLVSHVEILLENTSRGITQDFASELKVAVLSTLRSPRSPMNDWDFERLVAKLFPRLGASSVKITPRKSDKGDDIVAVFANLGVTIVAQVKYHPDPDWKTSEEGLNQLLRGMEERNADIGWFVTCGTFGFNIEEKEEKLIEQGKSIRFIDGEQLAGLLIDAGLSKADPLIEN